MMPAGPIVDELCDQVNNPRGTADPSYRKTVWRKINEAYREITCSWPWDTLKANSTLDDDTFLVPADCRVIQKVIDSDQRPYNFVQGLNRASDFNYNWYYATPIETVLASGTTLNVSEYAKAVSSTSEFPATTCAGEYIRIGSNPGIYKIATWTDISNIALSDYFRGDSESSARFEIRPLGTKVLAFADASGDAYTASGIEIAYIKYALPLYRDEDIIQLPGSCQALSIRTLQKLLAMLGFNQAADRMENKYIAAMTEMKASTTQDPIVQPSSMFKTSTTNKTSMSYIRGLSLLNQ